jgi:hypothetical protein
MLSAFCVPETQAQKPVPVFALGKNLGQTTELKLSDLATEISYLPLELTPKSLLAGINIILPAGNRLVVAASFCRMGDKDLFIPTRNGLKEDSNPVILSIRLKDM